MKNFLFILCTILCLVSCSKDEDIVTIINGSTSGTTVAKTSDCSLIVNVGDANYGTRATVGDGEVEATSTTEFSEMQIALLDAEAATPSWISYDKENLTKDHTDPYIQIGSTRGYVYAVPSLTNPYADMTAWQMTSSINAGKLTLTAKAMSGDDKDYVYPVPVAFWGNYPLVCSDEYLTTYNEGDESNSGSKWALGAVTSLTHTAAISKNIQYATSVFNPTVTVASNLTVYTSYDGKRTKEINSSSFPFTIQYVYINSASSVTYGNDFAYTTTGNSQYKYALKSNGFFGNTIGGTDKFVGFTTNTSSNFSILPTTATSVQVVLACYYMGTSGVAYIYSHKSNKYIPLKNGATFYIKGTLTADASSVVVNGSNSACNGWKGSEHGVFIPDVKTKATINISKLVEDSPNGDGTDDPVTTDDTSSDIKYKGLFNVNVEYGTMSANWALKQ